MKHIGFGAGVDTLFEQHREWVVGRRIGLLSHSAALDRWGCSTAQRLWDEPCIDLACLMGPEHGFFGRAGARARATPSRHPEWGIPVHSLYGMLREPRPRMLDGLDALVIDLQDLGTRCYTYVSTLQYVLQAAERAAIEVIVLDRPIPLPGVTDGPVTEEECRTFVSLVNAPLAYGLTPGETAIWLSHDLNLSVSVRVSKMSGYAGEPGRKPDWPPWMPPSPSIHSWDAARCYPATALFEAFPWLDHGRKTPLAFQVVSAPCARTADFVDAVCALRLPGVAFYPHWYAPEPTARRLTPGARMCVTNPAQFHPVLTGISLVQCAQEAIGNSALWRKHKAKPTLFDQLMGASWVRAALQDGESPARIAAQWNAGVQQFRRKTDPLRLYVD